MKYMGSKRVMLQNGLGALIEDEIVSVRRFVDLFSGSGAVATHVACRYQIPVLASDLQEYSVALAGAVIHRVHSLDCNKVWGAWYREASRRFSRMNVPEMSNITRTRVGKLRDWCGVNGGVIVRSYGGHYFSPLQAAWIDCLIASFPYDDCARSAALAALIRAASRAVAAPGHTAQPFQPTPTAKKFLKESWSRDIVEYTRSEFEKICLVHAKKKGKAIVGDANQIASTLKASDLVFIDPPYSGVHYSRFYHVLETIANGECGPVSGIGRYPEPGRRPRSKYSLKGESADALENLLGLIAAKGAKAIITFPDSDCSNGLSGDLVREIARRHFVVSERSVKSTFSTLGGPKASDGEPLKRLARHRTDELMLVMKPKRP